MKNLIKKLKYGQGGFTLVETLTYLFIMSMLILIISTMILNIFNTRKMMVSSQRLHDNARFIVNYFNNRIHNVDIIDDVSPEPEILHFYQLPDTRFSIANESGDLIFRQTEDGGTGFPDQSTGQAIMLNSRAVNLDNLVLTPIDDYLGNENQGVRISFTLSTGSTGDNYGYIQKTFTTFISLR
ncbi:hypothetical protein C0580_03405 [Candidatus Parcubacteria bacterium]|nr:MAG: hypothetical protein C0580_03405 [Candidatus Parcubacteria bacterium]